MADLASIVTSAAGGGVFGVLGPIANRFLGIWERKEARKDQQLANAHETQRWGHEKELLQIQMRQTAEANEQALDVAAMQGSWQGLAASLEAEARIAPSYRWVDAVRALTRPFLTLQSQAAMVMVFYLANEAGRTDLIEMLADTVAFCTTATVLWWFGERAQRRAKP